MTSLHNALVRARNTKPNLVFFTALSQPWSRRRFQIFKRVVYQSLYIGPWVMSSKTTTECPRLTNQWSGLHFFWRTVFGFTFMLNPVSLNPLLRWGYKILEEQVCHCQGLSIFLKHPLLQFCNSYNRFSYLNRINFHLKLCFNRHRFWNPDKWWPSISSWLFSKMTSYGLNDWGSITVGLISPLATTTSCLSLPLTSNVYR